MGRPNPGHSDYNDERVRTEIIDQRLVDPRMHVRPDPDHIQRAAKMLVGARLPLLIVGDEVHNAKAEDESREACRTARHAGDAGAPDLRQLPGRTIRCSSASSRPARCGR